jgi:UDP-glucose 4-epimerase
MNFIITGGAGFIGSHLADFLLNKGHSVKILDNLCGGKLENLAKVQDQIDFYKSDIMNYDKLRKIIKNTDGIFHLAALTSVQDSFSKPDEYERVNVKGTENILRAAKEFEIKVVFASSASVYGNPKKIPIKEDADKKPLNPYGKTKVESENLASKYAKMGVSVLTLRYFNVYGMHQNPAYAGVITKFLANIKDGNPLVIHGDGQQVRDFVYVGDVVNANFLAMKSKINHTVVNIGSGIPISINNLANMIIDISGLKVQLLHDDAQQGDIRSSQADIGIANKILKWKPKTNLEDWLKSVLKNNT